MRQIEYRMNQAILNQTNFKEKNTEVIYNPEDNTSHVYLHNNIIAIVGDNNIQLFDSGYQTHTTKSRINSILLLNGGGYVYQKDFQWYFSDENQTIYFTNGMIV